MGNWDCALYSFLERIDVYWHGLCYKSRYAVAHEEMMENIGYLQVQSNELYGFAFVMEWNDGDAWVCAI